MLRIENNIKWEIMFPHLIFTLHVKYLKFTCACIVWMLSQDMAEIPLCHVYKVTFLHVNNLIWAFLVFHLTKHFLLFKVKQPTQLD